MGASIKDLAALRSAREFPHPFGPMHPDDDLRSLNAQSEFVLREALRKAGRLPRPETKEKQQK